MSSLYKTSLAVWFNLAWFGCVYLGKNQLGNWSLFLPMVSIAILFFSGILSKRLSIYFAMVTIVGAAFDLIAFKLGLIRFQSEDFIILPVWLVSMWLLFAMVIPAMQGLFANRLLLAAIAGFIFGPLSYYYGESFEVLFFSSKISIVIYAVFWGLFFPAIIYFQRKLT